MPINSKDAGTKHIRTAGLPIFFNPDISSPRPALVRIMINAIFRRSADMPRILPSNRFKPYGPRTIPVINIPSRLGNLIFWQSHPMNIPKIRINAILNNIKFLLYTQKKLTLSALIYSQKSSAFISGLSNFITKGELHSLKIL